MSKKTIILKENETWPDLKNPQEKKDALDYFQSLTPSDKKLRELLVKKGILEFDLLQDNGMRIISNDFIGTVSFENFDLKIIPKIYSKNNSEIWKNVASCINFTQKFDSAKILEYQKISFTEQDKSLQDFIIWELVFECELLLHRGLLKSYVSHEENLPYLRGKLLLKHQFQNDVQKKAQFFCEYDELEYDNIENRIIFYILFLCQHIAISSNLKKHLFRLIEQFSSMVQKTPISISDIKKVMKSYNRQNLHYKDAHLICMLILKHVGISDFYHTNTSFAIPFFVKMYDVFEDFVTLFFKKYAESELKAQETRKGWNVDDKSGRAMKPDIILRNNESLTIVDVKYKPKLYPGDLYQIGFYIHEYTKKRENLTGNHAFAILPQYPDDFKKPHTFEATETKITVFERHLDLDKCMSLILNKDESKIKKLVKRILDPKDNLENLYS